VYKRQRNDLYTKLKGIQSPVLGLFEVFASAIEEMQGVVQEESNKARELKKKPREIFRKREDMQRDQIRGKQDMQDKIDDLAGISSPTAIRGKKGQITSDQILKASGLDKMFAPPTKQNQPTASNNIVPFKTQKPPAFDQMAEMRKSLGLPPGQTTVTGMDKVVGPQPKLQATSQAAQDVAALGQSATSAVGGLSELDAAYGRAFEAQDKELAVSNQLIANNKRLADMKLDTILLKKSKELQDAVTAVVDELRSLPNELARFGLDLQNFRRGPKALTIDEETSTQKQEAELDFNDKVEARRKLSKRLEGLETLDPNNSDAVGSIRDMIKGTGEVSGKLNKMLDLSLIHISEPTRR
jgi:hypothetical protein